MSRRLALLLLCLCGAVASAFNAPTDTLNGVTAEILSVHEATADLGAAVPFQVRLANRGTVPVTYTVRTYLNDDWTVATPQAAGTLTAQGGTADHAFAATPLPRFIIGDTFNRVVFESHGYTIGLGDQLLKTIHGL